MLLNNKLQHLKKKKYYSINTSMLTIQFQMLQQGLVSNKLIRFTKQLGTDNIQAITIIKTITKMAIKLARDQLWLPRCKLQIEWEKQNNITIKNKKSDSNTAKKNAVTKPNMQIKKPKHQNKQQFMELDGIFCYCGIAKQKNNNISCNKFNETIYIVNNIIIQEHVGSLLGSKVISLNM